jgi:hypothetical protein
LYAVFISSLLISGCTTLPSFPDNELETARVVQNIKCEFREAVIEIDHDGQWLKNWNAGFILTLFINHKGGLTTDATLLHPLTPGLFTLPFVASVAGETKRTEKINFLEKIRNLRQEQKFECPEGKKSLLAGKIGILDLLKRAKKSVTEADIVPTQLDYTLEFVITESGNLAPKFTMIPIGNINTLSAGVKWEGSRGNSHTLNITLIEKKPADCPQFEDFFKRYKICPTVVATIPLDQDDKEGVTVEGLAIGEGDLGVKKGLTAQEQRDLERALDRSILQDILQQDRENTAQ